MLDTRFRGYDNFFALTFATASAGPLRREHVGVARRLRRATARDPRRRRDERREKSRGGRHAEDRVKHYRQRSHRSCGVRLRRAVLPAVRELVREIQEEIVGEDGFGREGRQAGDRNFQRRRERHRRRFRKSRGPRSVSEYLGIGACSGRRQMQGGRRPCARSVLSRT